MQGEEVADLFPDSVGESPRLVWLREHDLIVREYQHPHSLNGDHRWLCANRAMTRYVAGPSEDDACLLFANREGIVFYKEAEFREAVR